MKYILPLVCVTLFFSCGVKPSQYQLTSELTFKSVSYTNFHRATEAQYQALLREIDTVLANPEKYKNSINLYRFIAKLEKHKILTAPQIHIYAEKDSIISVYLSEQAYEKVKHFNYNDLQKEQKKVLLTLTVVQKEKYIFYAEEITSVKKVDGVSRINGKAMQFISTSKPN